jgi:anti-sigma regulatory factor (Ser/Thr protein kinase)
VSAEPARIAVYSERRSPPKVLRISWKIDDGGAVPRLIEELTDRAYTLAQEQGGRLPVTVFRELIENLVHASFREVVITILDRGNTLRVSDHGPGIPDKQAALRAGFTSADAGAKRFIRGVGSGLSLVKETVSALDGALEIEDNLAGQGTVVTVRVAPQTEPAVAPGPDSAYNLSKRELKALLLTVELAPVGPTGIAREMGISTSTAYRDLVSLEKAGLVVSQAAGRRQVTDAGLSYLRTLM